MSDSKEVMQTRSNDAIPSVELVLHRLEEMSTLLDGLHGKIKENSAIGASAPHWWHEPIKSPNIAVREDIDSGDMLSLLKLASSTIDALIVAFEEGDSDFNSFCATIDGFDQDDGEDSPSPPPIPED